jgi:Glycosyltransferase
MKILYTNFHEGPWIGGHTNYVLRLAGALAARGHEVSVAAPPGSSLLRLAGQMPGIKAYPQVFPSRPAPLLRARGAMRALLCQGAFDIVHVNGSADHRLAMLARLGMVRPPRIVWTKHNDVPVSSFGNWLRARMATDHAIAVCHYVAGILQDSPYARRGISTVHNGIDTDYFSPLSGPEVERLRAQWTHGEDVLLLGSNAGTDEYKGWLDLVRAMRSLPEALRARVRVVLAGVPPKQSNWDEVIACGLASQVHYAGQLEDVRPMLAALDVGFVLSYRDTLSFACREMMAMGKPVIAARRGGLPESIDDGQDGWLVPPRDPQALADLLRRMLSGEYDLAAMGRRARDKSVADFGLDRFVSGTERVYRQVAGAATGT